MRAARALLLVLGVVGCGAEPIEPAQFGELCGVDGPFRLFTLAPGERVWDWPLSFADRYVYTTIKAQGTGDDMKYGESEAWSVGTCGESPRRLDDGVTSVWIDERWPDVLFGCRTEDRDIVTLDPAGIEAPHVVFADVDCYPRRNSPGLVAVVGEDTEDKDSPATLRYLPYPSDPRTEAAESIVLLDPLTQPEYPISESSRVIRIADDLFVLTTDGTLLRLGLPDGAVTVEQTGVYYFGLSGDGRYLLYQALGAGGEAQALNPAFIRDRTTGEGQILVVTDPSSLFAGFDYYDQGLIVVRLPDGTSRVYFLPALDFVALPPGLNLREQIDDGRWLMQPSFTEGPIYVGDLRDPGSLTMLFGGGTIFRVEAEGMLVLDAPPCCRTEGSREAEGGLWFVPFDGSTPRQVAERVSHNRVFVGEQSLVTTVKTGAHDELAALLLVDLEAGTEELVEQRVLVSEVGYFIGPTEDGVLRYSVVDGERAGVWLARLAAAQ